MVLGTTAAAWWLSATIYNYAQTSGRALPLQGRLGRTGTIGCLDHRGDAVRPVATYF